MKSKQIKDKLIEAGVAADYISFLESEIMKSDDVLYDTYLRVGKEEKIKIPVSKIKGISTGRGINGLSWMYNFIQTSECNFRETTVEKFRSKITSSNLGNFKASFVDHKFSDDNLRFSYFKEVDEYYTSGGGSHRTLFAKVIGAPYIYGKVITYQKDPVKEKNVFEIESKEEYLKSLIQTMNLHLEKEEEEIRIKFKTFPLSMFEENIINDFSDQNRVEERLDIYNEEIEYLKEIQSLHNRYKRIPTIFLRLKNSVSSYETLGDLIFLYEKGWSSE